MRQKPHHSSRSRMCSDAGLGSNCCSAKQQSADGWSDPFAVERVACAEAEPVEELVAAGGEGGGEGGEDGGASGCCGVVPTTEEFA
eukprot:CAMPEP_0119382600 /NCGR_PEP_ID=MMETSP1334-20130426/73570_1 /TAXON_ID=127549 /ORGANISM="Calcidiscus leptoporus, Strain RCC1130" /LENGTH=85 /DNA_ID=CAMNT_0007403133 /DNA_START=114 /DNA_END=367 /DNA_ORIENTATION=-